MRMALFVVAQSVKGWKNDRFKKPQADYIK